MTIDFMLAKEYLKGMPSPKSDENCIPPVGWIVSEKYDGYRARWMGETNHVFLSRAQKEFSGSPEWYKLAMPEENLDGELWVGRENFQSMGVVRKKAPDPEEWIPVKYLVYDIPDLDKPFSERLVLLRKIVKENKERWDEVKKTLPEELQIECPLKMAPQTVIESEEQMEGIYRTIIEKGGEGIMLKDPDSFYENKRSNYLLKYKPSFDEEAIIVDYKLGKGKYTGILGGFICKPLLNMDTYHLIDKDEQHEFSISGMDDEVRNEYKETHPIGTIISYEHSGKTDSGKPRFARYMRKRDDITVKDEIENPCTEKKKNILFILKKLADHEKANGEAFKANSYLKVISELKKLKDDSDFTEATIRGIKGVGDSIYQKIDQIMKTGSCPLYEKIKDIVDPRDALLKVHGIGPKRANELVKMGINTIDELKEKKEYLNEKQKIGLRYYDELNQPIPREEIVKHEKHLKTFLKKTDPNAELTISGSYRRNKAESGDIDVLLKADKKETYTKFIKKLVNQGYLIEELALGSKKYNGICRLGKNGSGRRIDIMYTTPSEYPFAILYFTGSGDFNQVMRKEVKQKGFTMNEYGIKSSETGKTVDYEFSVEKDIFDFLDMGYVEPWQRL
jgi:DNA polymerase/3'-5' exonuclease PolX